MEIRYRAMQRDEDFWSSDVEVLDRSAGRLRCSSEVVVYRLVVGLAFVLNCVSFIPRARLLL